MHARTCVYTHTFSIYILFRISCQKMREKSLPHCVRPLTGRKHSLFLGWKKRTRIWHIFPVKAFSYSWSDPGNAGSNSGHVCRIEKTKQSKMEKSSQWRVTSSLFFNIGPIFLWTLELVYSWASVKDCGHVAWSIPPGKLPAKEPSWWYT